MKLHAEQPNALNTITAYGDGYVEINRMRHTGSVHLMPQGEVKAWGPIDFDELSANHFEALAGEKPELVILGTGSKQRFVHPKLLASLSNQRIGVDMMDTQAACRTYNILMSEGRQVMLALLPLSPT